MKLVFSSIFESDFSEGMEYLARQAEEKVASEWALAVERTLLTLQKNPELGRLRRDLKPAGIRSFGVSGFSRYLIFYQVQGNELVLFRIKHGAMNLQALFSSE